MVQKEIGNEVDKTSGNVKGNNGNELRVTGGVIFVGSVDLLKQIVFLADTKGKLVYQRVTSPNKKLWIEEEE